MRNQWNFENEPYRVTWHRKAGSRVRTYSSEADARNALAAPFGPLDREAILERMEPTDIGTFLGWRGVRMDFRSRRPTDKRMR